MSKKYFFRKCSMTCKPQWMSYVTQFNTSPLWISAPPREGGRNLSFFLSGCYLVLSSYTVHSSGCTLHPTALGDEYQGCMSYMLFFNFFNLKIMRLTCFGNSNLTELYIFIELAIILLKHRHLWMH